MMGENPEEKWLEITSPFISPDGRDCPLPHETIMRSYERNAAASLEFKHDIKEIRLVFLEAYPPRQGHGSKLLNVIKNLCSEFRYSLHDYVSPYAPFSLAYIANEADRLKLGTWYRRHGFEIYDEDNQFRFIP